MGVLLQSSIELLPITVDQLDEISDRGFQFYKEAKLPGAFVPGVWRSTWVNLLNSGAGFILGLKKDGAWVAAIGGVVFPDINDGDMILTECFWFAFPEARGHALRLVKDFEVEGRSRGAKRAVMVHLLSVNAEVLGKVYRRMGYQPVETHYFKDL